MIAQTSGGVTAFSQSEIRGALQGAGRVFLRLRGASMAPELWPGDLLLARHSDIANVATGDIVVFTLGGALVAHRVVARHENGLITQGDASLHRDPMVTADRLLAVVDVVLRNGRCFMPQRHPPTHRQALAALLRRSSVLGKLAQRLRLVARGARS